MNEVTPAVDSVVATAGRTPLIRLAQLEKSGGPRLYAKCEFLGPTNSIFDRSAAAVMEAAGYAGHLSPGRPLVAAGGTDASISLAWIASAKGHPITVLVPASLHPERKRILQIYGAKLQVVDAALGFSGARREAFRTIHEVSALGLDLFEGQEIVRSYESIGREIAQALGHVPELTVCGLDLGAIPTGIARGLRTSHVVAVEPEKAPIGSGGPFGNHLLLGLAPAPEASALDREAVHDFEAVSDREAWEMSERLSRETGVLAGIVSSAILVAAQRRMAALPAEADLVAVLPDSGERRFMLAEFFT